MINGSNMETSTHIIVNMTLLEGLRFLFFGIIIIRFFSVTK